MAETTTHAPADAHGHDDHHPTESQYWVVFVVLAVLTALEVAWSYFGLDGLALILPLVIMMVVKFLLVTGAFMHLYFDFKIINGKLFALAFTGGLVLAMAVFTVVYAANEFQI